MTDRLRNTQIIIIELSKSSYIDWREKSGKVTKREIMKKGTTWKETNKIKEID